jgi:hypothetical protein
VNICRLKLRSEKFDDDYDDNDDNNNNNTKQYNCTVCAYNTLYIL